MKNIFLCAGWLLVVCHDLSGQCLAVPVCPSSPYAVSDASANSPYFWKEPFWYSAPYNSHDLPEAPVDLSVQITDSCGGEVHISYVLLLDLGGNANRETAISSLALPGPDTVYYNNAFNPNYTGGTVQHFDERPVPANQKYGFALEKTVQGNVTTARVRWATTAAPGNYVLPHLPFGIHYIEWRFEKDGEVQTCGYLFSIEDDQAPSVYCTNGLSVNILPLTSIQLSATDFLQAASDSLTPAPQLKFGIRRSGTGTGFPIGDTGQPVNKVLFVCDDLGAQPVELWARDVAGNASFCETTIIIQDNNGYCQQNGGLHQTCTTTACSGFTEAEDEVAFIVSESSVNGLPAMILFGLADESGCLLFGSTIGSHPKVTPYRDEHPTAGVTTLDLVRLSRHINGLEPFTENWQWVAADTDLNGILDTNDLVNCRNIALGQDSLTPYPDLRFYPLDFVFPAGNPLALPIPDYILLDSLVTGSPIAFASIKTCDFNCTALTETDENISVDASIGQPQPNPTTAGISIALWLEKPVAVTVEISDLTGRLLYRNTAAFDAVEKQIDVPGIAFAQSGIYIWRVQAGSEFRAGKVVKQ